MRLFVFGMGYTAQRLAQKVMQRGWQVAGTCRAQGACDALNAVGIKAIPFDGAAPNAMVSTLITDATHILVSIPPGEDGDPTLVHHGNDMIDTPALQWLGYLSTTGVYGDHQGDWVDEDTPYGATSVRGQRRVNAEQGWMQLHADHGSPTHLFRLPGIYGPGRSALDAIRQGRTRRIDKKGQVFCRIHVDDLVAGLMASMDRPNPGQAYNLTDDEPAPPQDVTTFAADLLGIDLPPAVAFEDAELTPMGRSFYEECKRVRNTRLKEELGVTLAYPTYREGLRAILAEE